MKTVTVSQKGWVVIPADLRTKYNLKTGSKVAFAELEGGIQIIPIPEDPIAAMVGMFKDTPELLQDLLDERRKEIERDEKLFQQLSSAGQKTAAAEVL